MRLLPYFFRLLFKREERPHGVCDFGSRRVFGRAQIRSRAAEDARAGRPPHGRGCPVRAARDVDQRVRAVRVLPRVIAAAGVMPNSRQTASSRPSAPFGLRTRQVVFI